MADRHGNAPGTMTAFIRRELLLASDEIDAIADGAPVDLVRFQTIAAATPIEDRPALREWIKRFNAGVATIAA